MDCKEFRELVDLYIDSELSPEATISAHAHLEGCIACRRVEQRLTLLRRMVKRAVGRHEPPPGLAHKVRRLALPAWRRLIPGLHTMEQPVTRSAETKISFWRRKVAVPAPVFALLLAAVVATAGWIIYTQPSIPQPASRTSVRKVAPAPTASDSVQGVDMAQFDRGERAAIYKVRLMDNRAQPPSGELR